MFGLGFSEILVLGVIALIFLGPEQLPELARTVGRFMNDLKRSTESITEDLKAQVNIDLQEKRRELSSESQDSHAEHSDGKTELHGLEKKEEQMDLFSEDHMSRIKENGENIQAQDQLELSEQAKLAENKTPKE
jgi:sec-independent protein translocase protein TatB